MLSQNLKKKMLLNVKIFHQYVKSGNAAKTLTHAHIWILSTFSIHTVGTAVVSIIRRKEA